MNARTMSKVLVSATKPACSIRREITKNACPKIPQRPLAMQKSHVSSLLGKLIVIPMAYLRIPMQMGQIIMQKSEKYVMVDNVGVFCNLRITTKE